MAQRSAARDGQWRSYYAKATVDLSRMGAMPVSRETDFWIPISSGAAAEMERRANKGPEKQVMFASSVYYTIRIQFACDLEAEFTDLILKELGAAIDGCVAANDIVRPDTTAPAILMPIRTLRMQLIAAQVDAAKARGNAAGYVDGPASDANRAADKAFHAAVGKVQGMLERRKRQLERAESEKVQLDADREERRAERADDVSARKRRERIDIVFRVAPLATALASSFGVTPAVVVASATVLASFGWEHFKPKHEF